MNLENTIQINDLNLESDLEIKQNEFLDSMLGKAINTGIDFGIRAVLPDVVEDHVIDIKNNLMNYGLKDGITKTINDVINLGKSAVGIVTGDFKNIEQMQTAIKSGGIIDSLSKLIDISINEVVKREMINSNVASMIKQGKNIILNSIESNIEKSFEKQISNINKLDKYINNWKQYYNNQNFNGMEKEYKKINKELKNLVPLENTIKDARNVENLHTLIKTNGHNFNLNESEKELLKKFN
ncbi:MAG: hypothetical protein IKF17_03715 [Clostridia bacterium]|nr:hypothetical protein [Clostridia bacterium]